MGGLTSAAAGWTLRLVIRVAVSVLVIICCVGGVFGRADAAQVTAPTLTGELFMDPVATATGDCDPATTATFTYATAGIATGAYPGTFTETGTVTIQPQPAGPPELLGQLPPAPLVSWTAAFAIDSPAGQVTGTKTLAVTGGTGNCYFYHLIGIPHIFRSAVGTLAYTAEITTASGTFSDHGTSVAGLHTDLGSGPFMETFTSALPTAEPVDVAPGNSPFFQHGRGCGDRNHQHERIGECAP